MFPEGFIKRIHDQKYIDDGSLLKALEESSPVSIRINPYKWNKGPSNAESVHWCKNGYYLDTRPSFTLDPLFHSGCYYPQEASGMFLEQAVRQAAGSLKNIKVLDLSGVPGGKSTHLSDIIGPDNLLVANEVIRSRASVLAETITKWGISNTVVTQSDPAIFGRLQGCFDIILYDAPCSGAVSCKVVYGSVQTTSLYNRHMWYGNDNMSHENTCMPQQKADKRQYLNFTFDAKHGAIEGYWNSCYIGIHKIPVLS